MDSEDASFSAQVMNAVRQCHDLGYQPNRFEQMLRNYGVLNTIKRLAETGDTQKGLARLQELNRLDHAIEATMLKPEFATLFSERQLETAPVV